MRALLNLALLLAGPVSAQLLVLNGPAGAVTPDASQAVGSLGFTGGLSTSSSDTVRIQRTGAMDVGSTGEFTVEFWIRPSATAGDNGRSVTEGASYASAGYAVDANLIWDADSEGSRGFILGIGGGAFYQGIWNAGGAYTLVGDTDLRDGAWHHVAAQFRVSDGLMEIFVDGVEEDSLDGPNGAVNYDGNAPATDAYHYIAKEKLDLTYGFNGDVSMIRVSDARRYTGTTYTVPTSPFSDDANTVGLYFFDEGSGTTLGDSSGNGFDGELINSPTWSAEDPF